jgi:hypothetical protein
MFQTYRLLLLLLLLLYSTTTTVRATEPRSFVRSCTVRPLYDVQCEKGLQKGDAYLRVISIIRDSKSMTDKVIAAQHSNTLRRTIQPLALLLLLLLQPLWTWHYIFDAQIISWTSIERTRDRWNGVCDKSIFCLRVLSITLIAPLNGVVVPLFGWIYIKEVLVCCGCL